MRRIMRSVRAICQRPPSPPRLFPDSGFKIIDSSIKLEEETLPHYGKTSFYPVQIGDLFQNRHQVVNKLGYGANSTVWFCRDLMEHEYDSLKVCTPSSKLHREVEVLGHVDGLNISSLGASLVRTLKDSFLIESPSGYKHCCVVMEPMIGSLADILCYIPNDRLPKSLLRMPLNDVLNALEFLHSQAGVVHTDIQPGNLMFNSRDPTTLFSEWEKLELKEPSPRKNAGEKGEPLSGLIQPEIYRSPEVILCLPWGTSTDIWNLGVMTWDIFRGDHVHLFHPSGDNYKLAKARMLAEMISLLGPPPREFLVRTDETLAYWNKEGEWRGLAEILPDYRFENLENWLRDDDQKQFLRFIRKMLVWEPEKRATAVELLRDEWLNTT